MRDNSSLASSPIGRAPAALLTAVLFCLASAAPGVVRPALALSELQPAGEAVDTPSEPAPAEKPALPPLEGPQVGPDGGLPSPAPAIRRSKQDENAAPEASAPSEPAAEILHDPTLLPAPVARMRELMIEAARSGEPERLRPLLGTGPSATRLSLGGIEEDPVEYLKSISGDGEGVEILAIMLDLLDAGFVRLDPGSPNELYVWPYFVVTDLEALKPEQQVQLLRIVTAGDLDDMRSFGSYNFFRIGITPEGEWRYFLAGD